MSEENTTASVGKLWQEIPESEAHWEVDDYAYMESTGKKIFLKPIATTPSGGGEKWTPEHVEQLAFSGGHASAYELIAAAHNATIK